MKTLRKFSIKMYHPTIIVEGFRAASKKAIDFLKKISIEIDPKDKSFLNKIADDINGIQNGDYKF